jgi:hypothetical protein
VAGWPREMDGVAAIVKEKETFRFDPANLVMRVLFILLRQFLHRQNGLS